MKKTILGLSLLACGINLAQADTLRVGDKVRFKPGVIVCTSREIFDAAVRYKAEGDKADYQALLSNLQCMDDLPTNLDYRIVIAGPKVIKFVYAEHNDYDDEHMRNHTIIPSEAAAVGGWFTYSTSVAKKY